MVHVNLRDVPVLGQFLAFGAIVADLLAAGGDLVVVVVIVVLDTVDLWVPLLATLNMVDLGWIPMGAVQTALSVGVALLLGVRLFRLLKRTKTTIENETEA